MNLALVTSQVTYVPENYEIPVIGLMEAFPGHIKALILIENQNISTLSKALFLPLAGAKEMGGCFIKNFLRSSPALDPKRKKARDLGIPVLSTSNINDPLFLLQLRNLNIDLLINMRTRSIFRQPLLDLPRLGCINIHHGLLPDYRGTLCDLRALHETREAGFTIHQMIAKVDQGRIIKRVVVSPASLAEKNYQNYLRKSASMEKEALTETINHVLNNGILPDSTSQYLKQNSKSHYSKTPSLSEIRLMIKDGMIL